jgi:hypothetical protein
LTVPDPFVLDVLDLLNLCEKFFYRRDIEIPFKQSGEYAEKFVGFAQ